MPQTLRISKYLLLGSLATLFLNKPLVFLFFKVSDPFLLASLAALGIARATGSLPTKTGSAGSAIMRKALAVSGIWILVTTTGIVASIAIVGPVTGWGPIMKEYARMLACIATGLLVLLFSERGFGFPKQAVGALMTAGIVPLLAYFPKGRMTAYLLDNAHLRFLGFFTDPNYYASFQIIPTVGLLFFSFRAFLDRAYARSFALYVLCAVSAGSILWSGSRSGVFGLVVALLGLFVLIALPHGQKKGVFSTIAALAIMSALSLPLGMLLLPRHAANGIHGRIRFIRTDTSSGPVLFTGRQDRFTIWKSSLPYLKNPFGYGPYYQNIIDLRGKTAQTHRIAHNTVLQVLLTGGIPLALLCLFLCLRIIRRLLRGGPLPGTVSLMAATLLGIMTSALFLDMLYYRWLWVVGALLSGLVLFPGQDTGRSAPTATGTPSGASS